jgi:hypothetical protein
MIKEILNFITARREVREVRMVRTLSHDELKVFGVDGVQALIDDINKSAARFNKYDMTVTVKVVHVAGKAKPDLLVTGVAHVRN